MAGRPSALKRAIAEKPLATAIGAHNPLSARLAERAGFDAIWASGFELSAAMGVPDASLISWTQHLDMARAMADAVAIPVLADVDTGYGNAVNVIHTVRHYEAAGIAGMVMEDKTFPKDTSLLAGGRQELVRIEEFEGKIQAAVATRADPDFVVIARTEALIAGLGQDEAMTRARAYAAAGADAILVHSKQKTPDEVVAFARSWDGPVPLALVPTAYPDLTEADIKALRTVRLVIYGNHAIRAAVAGMEAAFATIRREGGIRTVDKEIALLEHVFELQGVAAMKDAEKRYLR